MSELVARLIATLLLVLATTACAGDAPIAEPTPTGDLLKSAAAEATALVQQAQATAIVLEARMQATALVEQARLTGGTPTSTVQNQPVYASPTSPPAEETPAPQPDEPTPAAVEPEVPVQVVGVGFAAEGGMIMVRFVAPTDEAAKWWPGTVSVTDEGSGTVYNEIPVLPKVGPLIGRPKVSGQPGYVMLINAPPPLQPGALVTVVLGTHRFEHITVQ